MQTIEIPRFWVFRMLCGCVYGSIVADQRFPGMPGGMIDTNGAGSSRCTIPASA